MDKLVGVGVFGDSILKGIQVNPLNKKYCIDNQIEKEFVKGKYPIEVHNYSSFGCTVIKGKNQLLKRLNQNINCEAIIMDYGGNDCDYNWKLIAENPEGSFQPNTPIDVFKSTYSDIIITLKSRGILPILTTLPPLEPHKFFDWFCKDLNKENVMKWLGDVFTIYKHQESYSKVIQEIAMEQEVPLIDLRSEFIKAGNVEALLCEDGTHPNAMGQHLIAVAFEKYADKMFRNVTL